MMGVAGVGGLAGCPSGEGGTETAGETDAAGSTPTSVEGFGERTETAEPTATPEDLPEVGGTYTSALASDLTTLNSVYNSESTASAQIELAVHSAYTFRPGQNQFPRLFELTSDDNQVWVATLRENLRWSEPYGEVTAEDFVYLVQEVHQSDWANTVAASDWVQDGEPIPVEQTGTYEFQVELSNEDPLWYKKPRAWGMTVVPKDLIQSYVEAEDAEGLREDEDLVNLNYTGNLGPYDLEEWERQSRLTYNRADEYFMRDLAEDEDSDVPFLFAEAPYFETLEARIIPEPSSRIGAIETGEIDSVGVEPNQAVNLEGTDGLYLNVAPQPYNRPLFYNMRANGWEPFRRREVRQALGCAIDKQTYVEGIQRGYASPEYTWQPPWSEWFTSEVTEGIERYGTGDLLGPEVTRNRLSEALSDTDYGYDGDTLLDGEGEQVELKLMYQSGEDIEESTAEFVQQAFGQNAGIGVTIEAIQVNRFVGDYWRQQQPDNPEELEWNKGVNNFGPRDVATSAESWDMALIYGLNTYPMTPSSAEVFFKRDGAFNAYGYYPSWDAESVFQEMNEATTEAAYQEAVTTYLVEISKDQPMGMLSLGSGIGAYRDPVVGPEEEFFQSWKQPIYYKESE